MSVDFRSTTPEDAPAVTSLLTSVFSLDANAPLIAPRHLHWKNWQDRPGWQGSRGYVTTKDGAFTAHATVVPLSYAANGQRLRMAHLIDWVAHASSVGSGVTLLKKIAQMVDAIVAVGGSEMTQKIMPAIGFKQFGEATRWARPIRPLMRLAGQKPGWRLGAQFGRSVLWSLQAPSISTGGWTATRVAPERLPDASIPLPIARTGSPGIFERSPELFAYLTQCPITRLEVYSLADRNTVHGYFVLAHAPGQARIADLYVASEKPEEYRIAIQLAVSQAKENGKAAEVVSVTSDPMVGEAFAACGFHDRGKLPVRLLLRRGLVLPADTLRFQMIDSDPAFLHTNQHAYWA